MGLATPQRIRTLRRKLYVKAKDEPAFRFYSLYDKIWREDILRHAYAVAKSHKGAPGVDGVTFERIEAEGLSEWISGLQESLRTRTYRPQPVRRVYIPKPNGGQRPLGIPTIRDRVVQTAAVLVLLPIFEAGFAEEMYGYRPRRKAQDAMAKVHAVLKEGYTDVVDADLTRYFDEIPHEDLLRSVGRRIADGAVLRLIRLWLKAPIQERDKEGRIRMTGGRNHSRGTPQGGVVSPLLANVYMNRFLRAWRGRGVGQMLRAEVVAYADDFVILCKGTASKSLALTRQWMRSLKLTLNEDKTRLRDARRETFDFLGYTFGPMHDRRNGRRYLGVMPSRKSVGRLRERVRTILRTTNTEPWEAIVAQVNRVLVGWANYFNYGHVARPYWWVDAFLLRRARRFLVRRHKCRGQGTRRFRPEEVFGPCGLVSLGARKRAAGLHALA